jgi:RNA 3'-terminal phosphate cyclase
VEDLATGSVLDRYTADMVIPFLALAGGESRLRIPRETEHVTTGVWLARLFLGISATVRSSILVVEGRNSDTS